jgi:hypothetical protein
MSRRSSVAVALLVLAAALVPAVAASAAAKPSAGPLTLAVYGDSPYGNTPWAPGNIAANRWQQDETAAFIDTINQDSSVSEVIHVGDVHSGKQACTSGYDDEIAALWQGFQKPLAYTPGDNEWTDCHKATSLTKPGEFGGFFTSSPSFTGINYIADSALTTDPTTVPCYDYQCGNPVENLALVRNLFFAHPGQTLGSGTLSVTSQANAYDPAHPTDAQYVENVMWAQRDVVFVNINVPGGSNNDADPWYGIPATDSPTWSSELTAQVDQLRTAQNTERANRTDADIRWLDAAFALANSSHAKGVVISTQADMWDLDGKTPLHLANYEPIIAEIAANTTAFGRPVLLFNGDSHLYRSDNPMQQTAPCVGENDPATGQSVCTHDPNNSAWYNHAGMQLNVANFHRVVVHGDNYDPVLALEWLKLTVDPNANNKTTSTSFGPFSWEREPQPQLNP